MEGKWEAPRPRPCPLLSSQDYCAYKSILPTLIKHRRTTGPQRSRGWLGELNGGSLVQLCPTTTTPKKKKKGVKKPVCVSGGAAQTDVLAPWRARTHLCAPDDRVLFCAIWIYKKKRKKERKKCRSDCCGDSKKMCACLFPPLSSGVYNGDVELHHTLMTVFLCLFGAMERA